MSELQQPAWHWRRLAELAAGLTPSGQIGDGMVAEMKRCGLVVQNDPLPLVLHCPECGLQHIDEPNEATGWTNPPHRSHQCQRCNTIWRPCDLPTTGVAAVAMAGKADTYWPPRAAIPPGVYWGSDGGNFYSLETRQGMGQPFYARWCDRRREFPQDTDRACTSPGPVNCNLRLRAQAKVGDPIPKSCERCGLGPCPFFHDDGRRKA